MYDFKKIESKWKKKWKARGDHRTDMLNTEDKLYCLVMFSYPSGDKLHIGHWYNFGPTDTWARFMKIRGCNVFEPMGFDAFGLPAENFAIKHGGHPGDITDRNTTYMEKQLKAIGAMYDWSKKVNTSKSDYYKWTQWLFLQLYKHDLAYRKTAPVNWCTDCNTVLANEQVLDSHCERCDTDVVRRNLEQWFFRITRYADDLLSGLDDIDWPEKTKTMQTNWIGRSEGAEIDFEVEGRNDRIKVFTTRPDTLFGATYMVLAPEHPLVNEITAPENRKAVENYKGRAAKLSEIERLSTEKAKTGVFTGACALNPVNGERIPVWIADYVLITYGTGAVMAVPAHDERDHEFAVEYNLPVREVIEPPENADYEGAYTGEGRMINSGEFSGLNSKEGSDRITEYLEEKNSGKKAVSYRLRDWSISRQRYWGAPIPIIYCGECGTVPVPEEDLPVELPYDVDLSRSRSGRSPLASVPDFMNADCPECGAPAQREADTMDTFVCSSWYFLRYPCADRSDVPFDRETVNNWLPVDMYVGGSEHACGHLLYSRFVTRALYDMGFLSFKEPFKKLIHQGIITSGGSRMSKSRGNVVSPDEFVDKYGADTFRMYLMFMGDFTEGGDWNDEGINGISRFVNRVWRLVVEMGHLPVDKNGDRAYEKSLRIGKDKSFEDIADIRRIMHGTIKSVTADLERFSFNTAISRLMEFVNGLYKYTDGDRPPDRSFLFEAYSNLTVMLAPFAPHLGEELRERMGNKSSVFEAGWPEYVEEYLKTEEITIAVQVDGKVRANIKVPADSNERYIKEKALGNEKIHSRIKNGEVKKTIYVKGKLINIVVS